MRAKTRVMIRIEECAGRDCAICSTVCPTEAITVDSVARVDEDKCIGCGTCADNICPNYAISIIYEEAGQ